jgi:hypothetical protein
MTLATDLICLGSQEAFRATLPDTSLLPPASRAMRHGPHRSRDLAREVPQ